MKYLIFRNADLDYLLIVRNDHTHGGTAVIPFTGAIEMSSVLIAASNSFFRRSFKDVLQVYLPEMTVEEAGSPEDVMRCVRIRHPDLIFMGVHLAGRSGLLLAREIKGLYPQIIICVLADYDLPEYRRIAYQHGVDHFLLKDSLSGAEVAGLIKSVSPQKAAGF